MTVDNEVTSLNVENMGKTPRVPSDTVETRNKEIIIHNCEEEGERFLMLEEQKQHSVILPDNHEEVTLTFCSRGNTASVGPKVVEIPTSDDDDDDDSDIGKSPPRQQMTVSRTHPGQKRLCTRVTPPPQSQPSESVPSRQQGDFNLTSQAPTSQPSLNQLNQTAVKQQIIIESTLSQPTISQQSLSQAAPVVSDAAYTVVNQSERYQPGTITVQTTSGDDVNTVEQANKGFLQDLNQGAIHVVSMAAQSFPSLQASANYSNITSPSGSSNTSSPPYTRKLFPTGQADENGQNIAYDTSQGNLSDGGYESATSPYSPTNTASPLQNIDLLQDTESSQSIIQGDNTFLGIGYSSSPPVSVGNPEVLQPHTVSSRDNLNTDGLGMDMLDELLKSFNEESGSGNIDFPLSTVSNIANSNTGPLMTSTEPVNVYSPSPERPDSRSNDRPFLRSLLNMPENDIPKTPVMVKEFSFHANSPADSARSGFSPRSDMYDSDSQHSGYTLNTSRNNSHTATSKDIPGESLEDFQKMDMSDVPQEISDLALHFLENMPDGQALSDLGSDVLMDTGDDSDFTKFVSSILTQADTPQPQFGSVNKTTTSGSNNKTQAKSQLPKLIVNQSAQGRQTGSHFSVPVAPKKLGAQSSNSNSSFTSLHVDHGYHQTKGTKNQFSKVRSPNITSPLSRVNGQMGMNNSRPPYQAQKTCSRQSRETMSQLEKQLRGWGRDASTPDHNSSVRNGQPKPFLEQLLTGELTNDRYIEMEKERCRYMKGINHS